jgi:hypothetical protein
VSATVRVSITGSTVSVPACTPLPRCDFLVKSEASYRRTSCFSEGASREGQRALVSAGLNPAEVTTHKLSGLRKEQGLQSTPLTTARHQCLHALPGQEKKYVER